MPKINLFELRRGLFHFFGGMILILGISFLPQAKQIIFFLIILAILLMLAARDYKIPGLATVLCLLERKCNKNFPGINLIFYLISGLIAVQFFPKNIALASLAILAIGDPFAGFVGRHFGFWKAGKKHLNATIAAILVSAAFASLFVPAYLAITGAFTGMLVELIGIPYGKEKKIDDNLAIPLMSGLAMWVVYII